MQGIQKQNYNAQGNGQRSAGLDAYSMKWVFFPLLASSHTDSGHLSKRKCWKRWNGLQLAQAKCSKDHAVH